MKEGLLQLSCSCIGTKMSCRDDFSLKEEDLVRLEKAFEGFMRCQEEKDKEYCHLDYIVLRGIDPTFPLVHMVYTLFLNNCTSASQNLPVLPMNVYDEISQALKMMEMKRPDGWKKEYLQNKEDLALGNFRFGLQRHGYLAKDVYVSPFFAELEKPEDAPFGVNEETMTVKSSPLSSKVEMIKRRHKEEEATRGGAVNTVKEPSVLLVSEDIRDELERKKQKAKEKRERREAKRRTEEEVANSSSNISIDTPAGVIEVNIGGRVSAVEKREENAGETDKATYSLFDVNLPSVIDNIPEIDFEDLIAGFRDQPDYYGVDFEILDALAAGTTRAWLVPINAVDTITGDSLVTKIENQVLDPKVLKTVLNSGEHLDYINKNTGESSLHAVARRRCVPCERRKVMALLKSFRS
ncbi:hypothetical protein O3P69_018794 [Scylla paramamosain]|uniref:Uncharacterized protein n=1 Tax=Scylla paramamosain TaxID=85552 RepID=A0AAW0STR3_SCYPA